MKKLSLLFAFLLTLFGGTQAWADAKALPYEFGFEDAAEMGNWTPTNCKSYGDTYGTGRYSSSSYARSGNFSFRFYNSTTPPQYIITPELAISEDYGVILTFYHRSYSTYGTEKFKVGYSTTNNDVTATEPESFIWGDEIVSGLSYTEYKATFPKGTKYIAIQYTSRDQYYLYIDDFRVEFDTPYKKATSLTTADITSNTAVINWTAETTDATLTGWNLEYSVSGSENWTSASVGATTMSKTLENLSANTSYDVRIQAVYGNNLSEWVTTTFKTAKTSTAAAGFSDDFESDNGWDFTTVGTSVNTWMRGSGTNNGGASAMYITNDGSTNAYNPSGSMVAYASKLFTFEVGDYVISYDWKAIGESYYDFLRVALVPANDEITYPYSTISSSTLPTGWTELDGGYLSSKSEWSTVNKDLKISEAGNYQIVFAWRNDGSGGTNPPAAIDNFSIRVNNTPLPTELAISDITARTATLTWAGANNNTFDVYISESADAPAANVTPTAAGLTTNSYTFEDLTPETSYYAWVRSVSGNDKSEWVGTNAFTTLPSCIKPTGLTATELTSNSVTLTWTSDADNWNVQYKKATDTEWTDVAGNLSVTTCTITGLTPATAYQARVRTYCDANDQSAWTDAYAFTTDCAIVVVDANNTFTEDFSGNALPTCWTKIDNGSKTWTISNGKAYSGYYGDIYLILPKIAVTEDMKLAFDTYFTSTADYKKSSIVISKTGVSASDFDTTLHEFAKSELPTSSTTKEFSLGDFAGQDIYIAFKYEGNNGHGWYIDNVKVAYAPYVAVTGITVNPTELTMLAGDKQTLTATVLPENATEQTYTWSSSDETVATVTTAGLVTAVAPGTATITATSTESDAITATCAITVTAAVVPTALKATDITSTTASLTWTNGSEETTWQIKYGTESGNLNAESGDITAKPYAINGLTANTTYYASIRSKLGTAYSEWSEEIEFTTMNAGAAPGGSMEVTESFEDGINGWGKDNWGQVTVGTGWDMMGTYISGFSYNTNTDKYVKDGNTALYYDGTNNNNYVITPVICANTTITLWATGKNSGNTGHKVYLYNCTKVGNTYTIGTQLQAMYNGQNATVNTANELSTTAREFTYTVGDANTHVAILIANAAIDKMTYTAAAPTVAVITGANGYATFSSDKALDLTSENLPEGLVAYKAKVDGNNAIFTKLDQTVPANTGVLLKGAANTEYQIATATESAAIEDNEFLATDGTTVVTSDDSNFIFVLKKIGDLEFAKYVGTVPLPANKAYLSVPASNFAQGARLGIIFDGAATSIESVPTVRDTNAAIYNLQGQKVEQLRKGSIYIINGKKVVIK